MSKIKIKIQNLKKEFKNLEVIKGIDLTFEGGHVYGIVGRNGSGKSVFLKMLLGFMRPTEGSVNFLSAEKEWEPAIAAVLDGSNLYPDLTAKENLTYLAKFKNLIGEKEIEAVLEKVGLNPVNPTSIKKYSTGMKKRLLIAQAIMEPADILIMDEPTNGLDESGIELLYQIVEEIQKKGTIILITSHNKEDIHSMCDCVYRMKEGRLWQEKVE